MRKFPRSFEARGQADPLYLVRYQVDEPGRSSMIFSSEALRLVYQPESG